MWNANLFMVTVFTFLVQTPLFQIVSSDDIFNGHQELTKDHQNSDGESSKVKKSQDWSTCQPTPQIDQMQILEARMISMEGEFKRKMAAIEEKARIQEAKANEKEKQELSIRKDVDQLKAQMNKLVKDNEWVEIKSTNKRIKRPARLLPMSLLTNRRPNNTKDSEPSTCKELNDLGHTLNGFYVLRAPEKNPKAAIDIFEIVLCQFQKSLFYDPEITEKRYTNSMIKSSPFKESNEFTTSSSIQKKNNDDKKRIVFNVQRHSSYFLNGVVPFEIERLNIGGGMDYKKGIFTAPVSGIYYFAFKGMKSWDSVTLSVHLRVNTKEVARGYTKAVGYVIVENVNIIATLRIKKGDRVDLIKHEGELADSKTEFNTQFIGWLLSEDD